MLNRLIHSTAQIVEVDHLVIGAGAVGLSISKSLCQKGSVALIEKNRSFGEGIKPKPF